MRAKELIEELQKVEDDTEIYVLDELGFEERNIELDYDEDENIAGIVEFNRGL